MLTKHEMQTVILKAPCVKYITIIAALYATGARNGELRNIQLNDVGATGILLRVTKSGRERMVPMPKLLRRYINMHILLNRPVKYLFEGEKPGAPISERAIQYIVKECFFDSPEPAMTPHQIRHHFITHLIESGCNPMEVKILAGHVLLKTTEHYFHTSEYFLSKFDLLQDLL